MLFNLLSLFLRATVAPNRPAQVDIPVFKTLARSFCLAFPVRLSPHEGGSPFQAG
ncbi:hypothetical protein GTNG_1150 [Geobacillus thermodenitrificans NG80-2]|uniref:Uncharacterized protein n=1 Tax=Geobacillus thermodenitrificans (strain NG80-2) TaxID=420246 RepID=A4IMH0_GEOTN|nr:hypothetical protein GTNG_1150 [Geobacillus thermodenitrificans NG80-2]